MKNKGFMVLRNKSGSSIVYVLAVMLMLVIIGTSVLTAAVANAGFDRKQRDHIRGVMLADGLSTNIMYSLQTLGESQGEERLSTIIPVAVLLAHQEESIGGLLSHQITEGQTATIDELTSLILTVNFENDNSTFDLADGHVQIGEIIAHFPSHEVTWYDAISGIETSNDDSSEEELSGSDWGQDEPGVAYVHFEMLVSVTVLVNGAPMVSQSHYAFQGVFEEISVTLSNEEVAAQYDMVVESLGMGLLKGWEWRLMAYEKAAI